MNDLLNSTAELDVTAVPENLRDCISSTDPNEDIRKEKKIKRKARVAKALGITVSAITALRIILCPILCVVVLVFDAIIFFFLMMGGALMLAMATIVLPFLPLIVILLGFVLVVAALLLELTPMILGIVAFILAASAQMNARKHDVNSPECKKATASAKKVSLCGLILSIAAEPVAAIPTLLLSVPFLLVIVIAVVYLLQLLGLAIA